MEVSAIRSSQATALPTELGHRELAFCSSKAYGVGALYSRNNLSFSWSRKWKPSGLRFTAPMAVQSEPQLSKAVSRVPGGSKLGTVKLFVGLPLDLISPCNTVNHAKAIAAGLKALKLLGVEGVELPVWWGLVEREAMGKYDWSGYLSAAQMVQNAGLKLHVSLCFHGSKEANVSLPQWVSEIGESDANIFFSDRSGHRYEQCLSLAADDLPVLNGKTPIEAYREFCESFKASFLPRFGSIVKGVSVGLGPEGELRYPSHQRMAKGAAVPGVGEFQCYDENMLALLKRHAEETGKPLWGLGGPHDAPGYDQSPGSARFFSDESGSWESEYGEFFLSWYSDQLLSHADRVLSMANSVLNAGRAGRVELYGQLPLVHSWFGTRSHASELTAGFFNTCLRDGYNAVAEIFARNSCNMILPGMDLSDRDQPREACSNPELLLRQIGSACRKNRVKMSGQNSSFSDSPGGFEQIERNLLAEKLANLFTYQRMGAQFFSPEHFPLFAKFVRNLNRIELDYDDLIRDDDEGVVTASMTSEASNNMQAA